LVRDFIVVVSPIIHTNNAGGRRLVPRKPPNLTAAVEL